MTSHLFGYKPHDSSFRTEASDLAFHLAEFTAEFQTEADCLEELCRRSDTAVVHKCRHCGTFILNKQHGDRVSKCQNCNRQTWHTAGTFFEGIRAVKAWLAAIWLMERGIALSSSKFAEFFEIAQSTAFNILHKIRTVIRKHMEHDAPITSSASFLTVFRKRSSATPAHAHPRAEQEEVDRASIGCSKGSNSYEDAGATTSLAANIGAKYFGRVAAELTETPTAKEGSTEKDEAGETTAAVDATISTTGFSGREKVIHDLLTERPLSADRLCELTGLEPAELSVSLFILELSMLVRREPGDYYVHCKPESNHDIANLSAGGDDGRDKTERSIAEATGFIIDRCHGISRKYLQNYLAAYWCRSDRKTWCQGSLLQLCRQSPRIKQSEILEYVTPPMVKLVSAHEYSF